MDGEWIGRKILINSGELLERNREWSDAFRKLKSKRLATFSG